MLSVKQFQLQFYAYGSRLCSWCAKLSKSLDDEDWNFGCCGLYEPRGPYVPQWAVLLAPHPCCIVVCNMHVCGCRSVTALSFLLVISRLCTGCQSHLHQQWNGTSPALCTMACPAIKGSISRCWHLHNAVHVPDILLSHLYDCLCGATGDFTAFIICYL